MQDVLAVILNQGITGAVCVILFNFYSKRDKLLLKNYEERLADKNQIIEKLTDNQLQIAQVIDTFKEIKPVMEEIRELLRKVYTRRLDL